MQRGLQVLSLLAFLGAADEHIAARSAQRPGAWRSSGTGLVVLLYALTALLLTLQLPMDVVLEIKRKGLTPLQVC